MSYLTHFQSGNLVLPTALLFHYKDIFSDVKEFLVWQFFYLQNTTHLEVEEVAPGQIAKALGLTLTEVNECISNLVKQDLLDHKTIELNGEIEMLVDASPALVKLDKLLTTDEIKETPAPFVDKGEAIKKLTDDLEQAMGLLNPMILEDVQKLVYEEHTEPELIREALREAVFNNKTNWKYIQAILRNWRKEGVTTLRQVEERRLEHEQANPANIEVPDELLSSMSLWED